MYRLTFAGACLLVSTTAHAFDVTSCDTHIEVNQTGVLTGNLHCTGPGPVPIIIDRGGTLDLNGFTLSYDAVTTVTWRAPILCRGWCRVVSTAEQPGHVAGVGNPETIGIRMEASRVRVENVEISGFESGIRETTPSSAPKQLIRVHLRDVVLRDLSGHGAFAVRKVKGENVTIAGSTASGFFVQGQIRLVGFTCVDGADRCVTALKNLRVDDALASGATDAALYGTRVKVRDSVVTGSLVDIASEKKPKIRNTSCDTSANLSVSGTNWGVCALD